VPSRAAPNDCHKREQALLNVLYLASNVGDSTVAKRLNMLRDGGAAVTMAGFRRAGSPLPDMDAQSCIVLGETFDARFIQRIAAIARAAGPLRQSMRGRPGPDIIVARNLEMLFLAGRLQAMWGGAPAIAYECLDIHRLLLRPDVVGHSLRGIERRLMRRASLLLTSSPAFVRAYFEAYGQADALPTLLVENKVYGGESGRGSNPALRAEDAGRPVRIGWFGALRCHKSLSVLATLAGQMDGAVEIVLRGRPALTEFNDFHRFVGAQRALRYEGAYQSPGDLAQIYSDVHFAWAIDHFEAGKNSDWLLPNRIYEGCLHGAIPIALAGTETAAFLKTNRIGIVLPDTEAETLARVFGGLDRGELRRMAADVAQTAVGTFAFDRAACRALVERLEQAADARRAPLEVAA
jgi:succinoglycan biosynthesis protein ExoL